MFLTTLESDFFNFGFYRIGENPKFESNVAKIEFLQLWNLNLTNIERGLTLRE